MRTSAALVEPQLRTRTLFVLVTLQWGLDPFCQGIGHLVEHQHRSGFRSGSTDTPSLNRMCKVICAAFLFRIIAMSMHVHVLFLGTPSVNFNVCMNVAYCHMKRISFTCLLTHLSVIYFVCSTPEHHSGV